MSTLSLGIEFGSTRIKLVLINDQFETLCTSSYTWENQLVDGYWTYDEKDFWVGLQSAYEDLNMSFNKTYHKDIDHIDYLGISGMMHGYIALDEHDQLLTPFRTWRNNTASKAAANLSDLFDFHIPNRWTIAHLYQAIIDQEPHIKDIKYVTTLAGYIHYKLTGEKVVGIGEASGIFPIDPITKSYDQKMIDQFNQLLNDENLDYKLEDILPKVLIAGQFAGEVKSYELLDPKKHITSKIKCCPPEGDAGTGMVATDSIKPLTGNVSIGTSIFSMIVLDKALSKRYDEIDIVTTPVGDLVAMVHCNNGTSELNEWISMFHQYQKMINPKLDISDTYQLLFNEALKDINTPLDMTLYNYFSGEDLTDVKDGRPLFVRQIGSHLNLSKFMRMQLYSMLTTLSIGMDILTDHENIQIDILNAHGGVFQTPNVMDNILSSALNTTVRTSNASSEGGAWGMAILAAYLKHHETPFQTYLDDHIFNKHQFSLIKPNIDIHRDFNHFKSMFIKGLPLEKMASKYI